MKSPFSSSSSFLCWVARRTYSLSCGKSSLTYFTKEFGAKAEKTSSSGRTIWKSGNSLIIMEYIAQNLFYKELSPVILWIRVLINWLNLRMSFFKSTCLAILKSSYYPKSTSNAISFWLRTESCMILGTSTWCICAGKAYLDGYTIFIISPSDSPKYENSSSLTISSILILSWSTGTRSNILIKF